MRFSLVKNRNKKNCDFFAIKKILCIFFRRFKKKLKKLTSGAENFLWLYGTNICGLMSKLLFRTPPDIWVENFVTNPQFWYHLPVYPMGSPMHLMGSPMHPMCPPMYSMGPPMYPMGSPMYPMGTPM